MITQLCLSLYFGHLTIIIFYVVTKLFKIKNFSYSGLMWFFYWSSNKINPLMFRKVVILFLIIKNSINLAVNIYKICQFNPNSKFFKIYIKKIQL